MRACETGEPWPEAELDEARHTWPLRELVLLVHVLESQLCGWTCDALMEIAQAARVANEHAIVHARPRSLLESYTQARLRMAEVSSWRRALEAAAPD